MTEPTFALEILTPEKALYSGPCTALTVRLEDGELAILANHAPLLAALPAGRLKLRIGTEISFFSCGPAFLKVTPSGVSVFARDGE